MTERVLGWLVRVASLAMIDTARWVRRTFGKGDQSGEPQPDSNDASAGGRP